MPLQLAHALVLVLIAVAPITVLGDLGKAFQARIQDAIVDAADLLLREREKDRIKEDGKHS